MAKLLKLRRGTTTQHGSFTGAEGEVTVDTDKETLVVHDGSTAGGHPVAAEDMANVSSASIAGRLATDSIAPAKIAAGTLPTDVTVASANIVNGTIVSGDIADGTIVNADVNASAAIAGTKVSPDFGSQAIVTTGSASVSGDLDVAADIRHIGDTNTKIAFTTDTINLRTGGASRLQCTDTTVDVTGNLNVSSGADVTGNITVTGTVDGRDVAADGTKLDTYEANGSSYVRSDADDTLNGQYTINDSADEKLVLSGSNNPHIRWQEGTQNKAYIQWNSSGHIRIVNQEDGSILKIQDDISFSSDDGSTFNKVWHAGNDGSGSGLDADTLDGINSTTLARIDGTDMGATTFRVNGTDFIVQDSTDGVSNYIWRDHSANKLYLGTAAAVIHARSHVLPQDDSTYDIGTSSVRFANGYFDTLHGDGSQLTGVQPFPSGTKMLFQQTSAPTGWTKITSSVDNKALRVVSGSVSSGGNQAFTSAFASRTPAGNVGASGNSTASFSGSVSGNTGNSGASTSNVNTGGNVNNHTLSNNQMPSHSHSTAFRNKQDYGSNQGDGTRQWENANSSYNIGTNNSGGSGSHSHGFSGSGHSHNVNNHTHSFSANFSGNTGNHTHNAGSFSGTAMDFAVQYLDVIICSKD